MLQFVVKLAAHIKHHILAHGVEQQRLKIKKHKSQELHAEIESNQQSEPRQLARQDVPVNRILSKLRLQNSEQV